MEFLNSREYMQQRTSPQISAAMWLYLTLVVVEIYLSFINHRLPKRTVHIMPATPGQGPPALATEAQTSTIHVQRNV